MKLKLSSAPQAITGLSQDAIYLIQNRSGCALAVEPASSVPTDTTGAYLIGAMQTMEIQRTAGMQIYVTATQFTSPNEIGYLIVHLAPQ